MRFEIRRLHEEFGITAIDVTHDQAEAMVTFGSTPKAMCWEDPALAHRLLDLLAQAVAQYLKAQAAAGAQVLMIFEHLGRPACPGRVPGFLPALPGPGHRGTPRGCARRRPAAGAVLQGRQPAPCRAGGHRMCRARRRLDHRPRPGPRGHWRPGGPARQPGPRGDACQSRGIRREARRVMDSYVPGLATYSTSATASRPKLTPPTCPSWSTKSTPTAAPCARPDRPGRD